VNTYVKKTIKRLCKQYVKGRRGVALDVGAFDINGTLGGSIPKRWKYVGTDILAGDNVDLVMTGEFKIPLPSNDVDLVLSTSCLEHCRNPFKLVKEMARVLKVGSYMFICAPYDLPIHKEQLDGTELYDCWRFLPDGFNCLLKEAKMKIIHTYIEQRRAGRVYCWGIAQK